MRKWLWCAAAAAVAGVGAAGYYAYQQPHSLVGQVVTQVGQLSWQANPVAQLTRHILTGASRHQEAGCCEGRDEPIAEALPEEPTPVECPAVGWPLVAGATVPPGVPGPDPIVIREEEPGAIPGVGLIVSPMTNADNEVPAPPPAGEVPVTVESGPAPRIMPYTPEEGSSKPMPPVPATPVDPYDPANFSPPNEAKTVTGAAEEAEPAETRAGTAESEEPKLDESVTDPGSISRYHHCPDSYHSRYMVCPYSGKCVEITPPGECSKECPAKTDRCPSGMEESEPIPAPTLKEGEPQADEPVKTAPKGKKSRKKITQTQSFYPPGFLLAPYIDTMEYRASDRTLAEIGPGPF